jgi:hypothetical protein
MIKILHGLSLIKEISKSRGVADEIQRRLSLDNTGVLPNKDV